jgi:type I restriction enzyme S subunit
MKLAQANELWLEVVPADWPASRIRNVARLSPGYSDGAPDSNEPCTVVPMELLSDDGTIDTTSVQAFEDVTAGLTLFEAGDVLFAKITPCMENGKGAFVHSLPTRYAFGSTEFHVLRPYYFVNPKFLYYYTLNPIYRTYAAENMSGAAGQKRVSSRFLKDTRLYLPPLPEQERIAAYLDASCAAIDAAVTAKRRQLETLDALHRALLHTAFANNDWPTERVKDVARKIGSGVTPEGGASVYQDRGIPLLRSQNVHFDGLRLDDVAFISEKTHADMAGSQLESGDVLLNITGASIGRCTFVPSHFGEGNVNQHVCIIRGNHKVEHRFLAAYLSSPIGQGQVLSSFTGASRQGLSQKELGLINIPLPSCDVQRQVVHQLEEHGSRQKHVYTKTESQIETLIAYRKSLIHECVTGQRRVSVAGVSAQTERAAADVEGALIGDMSHA